jgi:hypothetical protein
LFQKELRQTKGAAEATVVYSTEFANEEKLEVNVKKLKIFLRDDI